MNEESNNNIRDEDNGTVFGGTPIKDDSPLYNQFDSYVPNDSLRGASRYMDSFVNRMESDPINSLGYTATKLYNKFPKFSDTESSLDSSPSYYLYQKMLGNEIPINDNSSYDARYVANLNSSPNYVQRFVQSSLGVDYTYGSQVVKGVTASSLTLASNLNISLHNPATTAEIREKLYDSTHGYSLAGFSSRFKPENTSASPVMIGSAYAALEESLPHRSQTDVVQGVIGFQSRPDTSFYQQLLAGPALEGGSVELNATFFQFQNTDIIQTLFNKGVSFKIVTQQLDAKDFAGDNAQKIGILAGNELILNATDTLNANRTVLNKNEAKGVKYHNSFHPKIGYSTINRVDGSTYRIGFIGTQNITAATSRHSTIESMLFVRERTDINKDTITKTEGQLFREIETFQKFMFADNDTSFIDKLNNRSLALEQEIIRRQSAGNPMSRQEIDKAQKKIYEDATTSLETRVTANLGLRDSQKYLHFNQNIFGSGKEGEGAYTKLLKSVIDNQDFKAVVSFDTINKLTLSNNQKHAFIQHLETLAKDGRLQVVISSGDYQKAMNGLNNAADRELLTLLAEKKALNLSVTTKHHDKSIAVYDADNTLKALALGSANPTRTSIGLSRTYSDGTILDNGGNIEVAAVIGLNNLKGGDKDEQDYLSELQKVGMIDSHYFGLTGGSIGIPDFTRRSDNLKLKALGRAYKTESPAVLLIKEQERVSQMMRLKDAINNYTQTGSQVGSKYGSIVATLRYEPQMRAKFDYNGDVQNWGKDHPILKGQSYYDAPIGLRITVTGPDFNHNLTFDATVTEEGNIVIPDLNKIINGAMWSNKTNSPITIFDKAPSWDSGFIQKRTINPGDPATKLTPFETLLAFAETVQRSFIYQEEFGLVDIMFRDSVATDENRVLNQIKYIFEDAFATALPKQFGMSADYSSSVNLKTILASLTTKIDPETNGQDYLRILDQVAEHMTTKIYGKSIIDRGAISADARKYHIFTALTETLNIDKTNKSKILKLDDVVATKFLQTLLLSNSDIFNDIKKELIFNIEQTRVKYKSASLTQARSMLDELLSSFLAVHEETYGYYQGQERLGIFGETVSFDSYGEDSKIRAQYRAGLLNPLGISHSTPVAAPGVLYRSLAATAFGKPLMLPAYGGLKQLTVIDSDLSSGAAVGQDFLYGMTKSSPGFSLVTKDTHLQHVLNILKSLDSDINTDEITSIEQAREVKELAGYIEFLDFNFGTSSKLIFTPFEKLEQLTQRIKNIVGFRPALEFSEDFASSLLNLFGDSSAQLKQYFNITKQYTASNILDYANYLDDYSNLNPTHSLLAGQLRYVLPAQQFEQISQTIGLLGKDNASYEQLQEYYRKQLLKQGNVQHGFIGGTKYKRLALSLGTSFLGDFSYLNAGYQYNVDDNGIGTSTIYGKQHNLRIKFNPERVDNVPSTITEFIKLFGAGGAVAITETFSLRGEKQTPGLYKVKTDGNLGERIGTFTDTGLIKLDITKVSVKHKTPYGPRVEPFLIKVPAWAKRTEGGITYIAPSPNLVDTARTTNIIELDTYTIFRPGTSSRWGGGGLGKGPVVYLEDQLFKDLAEETKVGGLLPQEFRKDRLYGLTSMSVFKGLNVETGLVLFQDSSFRTQLVTDTQNVLISLATLFTKDKNIKLALIEYLRDKGDSRGAAALLLNKGVDISEGTVPQKGKLTDNFSKNTLAFTASGLLMLGGEDAVKNLDFSYLKKEVLTSLTKGELTGDLEFNLHRLIELGVKSGLSTERNGEADSQLIFSDSNPITRSVGLLSHLLYFTSQIYNTKRKSVANLYEIGLNNTELYKGTIKDVQGYTTDHYRSFVNQTLRAMGYNPKSLITEKPEGVVDEKNLEYNLSLMSLAQSRLDNQFVIETLIDNQISQSLVASGMRDVVKQEYQFYMGMMNRKLNEYRNVVGAQGVSIQQAYLEAIAVSEGDMNAMTREQTLSFRLAMSTMDTFDDKTRLNYSVPGEVLRYQDIKLRDLALMYSPSIAESGARTIVTGDKAGTVVTQDIPGVETTRYSKDFNASVLNIITSNTGINIEQSLLLTAGNLNKYQEYISEVTSSGYSKGLIAMAKVIQEQLNQQQDQNSAYSKYLKISLENLTKSQRIVLPYIEFQQTEDGYFIGAMRPTDQYSPTTGILLGSDFVTRIGQSYGDFETDIMKAQIQLVETLSKAQPVLDKFMSGLDNKTGKPVIPRLSEAEHRLIKELQSALEVSGKTLIDIPITDISRQYAGDHESMTGAVGIATNSFLLAPNEVLLGKRYLRIAGTVDPSNGFHEKNSKVGTAINTLIKNLDFSESSLTTESISTIQTLMVNFGIIDLTFKNVGEYLDNIQTKYESFFSKLKNLDFFNTLFDDALGGTNNLSSYKSETKQIITSLLVRAKLYTDLLGFSTKTNSNDNYISHDILREIILDTINPADITKNNLEGLITKYAEREYSSYTLEKMAYLGAGFIFSRTGQPGGSSGLDSDLNEFYPIHLQKYLARQKDISPEARFRIHQDRLSTGVVVPSNSRLISGLGDYDGDSYRLTMKQIPALLDDNTNVIDPKDSILIKRRNNLKRELKDLKTDLNITYTSLNNILDTLVTGKSKKDLFDEYLNNKTKIENSQTIFSQLDNSYNTTYNKLLELNKLILVQPNSNKDNSIPTQYKNIISNLIKYSTSVKRQSKLIHDNFTLIDYDNNDYADSSIYIKQTKFNRVTAEYTQYLATIQKPNVKGEEVSFLANTYKLITSQIEKSKKPKATPFNQLGTIIDTFNADVTNYANMADNQKSGVTIKSFEEFSATLKFLADLTNNITGLSKKETNNIKGHFHRKLYSSFEYLVDALDSSKYLINSDLYLDFDTDVNRIIATRDTINNLNSQISVKSKQLEELDIELHNFDSPVFQTLFTRSERFARKQESLHLRDTERFIKSYTNVPSFMFGAVADEGQFTSGELINLISQKYDFGNISDASAYNKTDILQTLITKHLIDKTVSNDISSILNNQVDLNTLVDNDNFRVIVQDTLGLDTNNSSNLTIQDLLNRLGIRTHETKTIAGQEVTSITQAAVVAVNTFKDLSSTLSKSNFIDVFTKIQEVSQQAQGVSVLDKKLLGRHLNTLLTPEEFTVAISIIGLGGTDLIGRAYNTLIPLLDTVLIEQSFMYSQVSKDMKTVLSKKEDGNLVYDNLRQQLGVVFERDSDDTINSIRKNRINIRNKFAGTISVLANFQQIVRDALKAKEGGSILTRFHDIDSYGEEVNSILSILTSHITEDKSSVKSESEMRSAMSLFLKTKMGPEVNLNNIDRTLQDRLFTMSGITKDTFSHILDVGEAVTGFGALYYLDSYARTDMSENLYEKFITNSIFGDQSEYFKDWAKLQLGSEVSDSTDWTANEYKHVIKNFVGSQIVDLMQRTQVSFSISSLKEDNVNLIAERLSKMVAYFEKGVKQDKDNKGYNTRNIKISGKEGDLYDLKMFSSEEIKDLLNLADDKDLTTILGKSQGEEYTQGLLDKEYFQQNRDEIAEQFREQYKLYKIYEELAAEPNANKKQLNQQLVSSIMLAQMKYRDDKYKILTPDTIEYLRHSALDLSLLTDEDLNNLDPANKVKLASRFAYSQLLRGLRSGKITDTATALDAGQFKLGTVLHVLAENNITLNDLFSVEETTTKQQLEQLINNHKELGVEYVSEAKPNSPEVNAKVKDMTLGAILTGFTYATGFDDKTSAELLHFMISNHEIPTDDQGNKRVVTGFQLIAEQSAGLATIEKLVQAKQRAYNAQDYTLAEALNSRLRTYSSSIDSDYSTFNTPTLIDINDYNLDSSLAQQAEDTVQKIIAETQDSIYAHQEETQKRRLGVMQSAPIVGILAGPLLFALASSDLKADERVAMFAYDVIQGAAELSTRPKTSYAQYVGTQPHGVSGFRMARVRQSINTHGLLYGSIQGIGSELLYQGIGSIADTIVHSTIGKRAYKNPNLGTVGAAASSELLAAVLTQVVTRAISNKIYKKAIKQEAESVDYSALRQQLSNQLLEAYNAQQEREYQVTNNETNYNEEVSITLDDVVFAQESDSKINEYTGWNNALLDSDGFEINTSFEGPNDPYYYATAQDVARGNV